MRILSNRVVRAGIAAALLVTAAGCSGGPDVAGKRVGGARAVIARDGIFDVSRTNEAAFRVRVDAVLRDERRTALRLTVTNLEAATQVGIDRFGDSGSDYSFAGFKLLDPVGGRLYYGYRADGSSGLGYGSRLHEIELQPGVHYSAVVYFPPLPAGVGAVTVLSPGTTGEITGVPVTAGSFTAPPVADGAAGSQQVTALNSRRPPGATVELPGVEPAPGAWSLAADVSGTSADADSETTSSPRERTVALRSDILFAFGKATLTARATALIAAAAREIGAGGDPGRPLALVGHTDAVGTTADNQVLSERRARAVEARLRADLGGGWSFTVSGKGESEPLAAERNPDGSDNPAARARNRRVAIGYAVRQESDVPSGAATAGPAADGGTPAVFRADDGAVVAERDGRSDSGSDAAGPVLFHLAVHPFRRDGRYLVAVFDLTNSSGAKLDTDWGYFRSPAYPGPSYASFAVLDPATGTAYRTAFVTVDGVPQYLDGRLHGLVTARPQRAYLYVPAPPVRVTSVTFDAGPFGKITDVPIA